MIRNHTIRRMERIQHKFKRGDKTKTKHGEICKQELVGTNIKVASLIIFAIKVKSKTRSSSRMRYQKQNKQKEANIKQTHNNSVKCK